MGTATLGARQRIDPGRIAAVLAAVLLWCGPLVCLPADAQSPEHRAAKPAAKAAKARATKQRKAGAPASQSTSARAAANAATAPRPAKLLDAAKVDPLQLDVDRVNLKKLNARTPNAWIVLGVLEMRGGNLAGAQASLEYAMTLGDKRHDEAAVAAAARALARMHTGRLGMLRGSARGAGMFGARPDAELTNSINGTQEKAKALLEKAIAIHKSMGRKDALAGDYTRLGDVYSTAEEYDQAQTAIGEALDLNKALGRKKEMAANYRALAKTHRYDLDEAESLLKEAAALHEALDLKEELASDYKMLAANNTTRGEPYEAEKLYKQALALAPKRDQTSLLRALEQLYRDRDDPGQAADMNEQASALSKELEQDGGGRMILFSSKLGMFVSSYAGKDQLASLERVVPVEKKLSHWAGLATSYMLLGLQYGQRAEIQQDKHEEFEERAEAAYRKAIALDKSLGREEPLAYAYRELILILDKRGRSGEVEATLKNALALHKKLGDGEMARVYLRLGSAGKDRGDAAQACAYWRSGALEFPDNKTLVDTLNSNHCASTQ